MSGPLLVKLGGALLDDGLALASTVDSLVRMHEGSPGSAVVVHGGGAAVDRELVRRGLPITRRNGIRVTPADQAAVIAAVLHGECNTLLTGALQARGVCAAGLRLTDGDSTRLGFMDEATLGRVGTVLGGDPAFLRTLLGRGVMPILSSIGVGADGLPLNVNADDAVAAIARILGAAALVFLTDVPGVLDASGTLIPELGASETESLIAAGTITGGMAVKVRSALATAETTGIPVVIATWKDPEALPTLARGGSAGTRIGAMAPKELASCTR